MASVSQRDVGIDVAKAALIAMMLLYHSFNNAQDATTTAIDQSININRWMGLVTGSFPFVVGFLIGLNYFGIAAPSLRRIWTLIVRGSKLIGLYLAANLALVLFILIFGRVSITLPKADNVAQILLSEPLHVVYDLLGPIAEIILIGAGLLLIKRYLRLNNMVVRVAAVGSAVLLAAFGNQLLLYLGCGLIGLSLGSISTDVRVRETLARYRWLAVAGLAPGIWLAFDRLVPQENGLVYLLSVTGLFFVYHYLGGLASFGREGPVSKITNLFSRSSLVIYIVHIPLLLLVTLLVSPLFNASQLWLAFAALSVFIFAVMGVLAYMLDRLPERLLARFA